MGRRRKRSWQHARLLSTELTAASVPPSLADDLFRPIRSGTTCWDATAMAAAAGAFCRSAGRNFLLAFLIPENTVHPLTPLLDHPTALPGAARDPSGSRGRLGTSWRAAAGDPPPREIGGDLRHAASAPPGPTSVTDSSTISKPVRRHHYCLGPAALLRRFPGLRLDVLRSAAPVVPTIRARPLPVAWHGCITPARARPVHAGLRFHGNSLEITRQPQPLPP